MAQWDELADDSALTRTAAALVANGIEAEVAHDSDRARERVLSFIPPGAEVFTMTSRTLEATGLKAEIDESGRYFSVRKHLADPAGSMTEKEKRRMGAAPDWALGSVHAVTLDGRLLIASMTGSQLPAYAYGAEHVIWVVGAQKVVADADEAMRRIREYVLPLEDQRMRSLYNLASSVNKILTIYREVVPDRLRLVLVKERLGF
jgi:acyl-CoA hydrolase